jgi:hypothetical protein
MAAKSTGTKPPSSRAGRCQNADRFHAYRHQSAAENHDPQIFQLVARPAEIFVDHGFRQHFDVDKRGNGLRSGIFQRGF